MTGGELRSLAKVAGLTATGLFGLGGVVVIEQQLRGPLAVAPVLFTLAYVAAWVVVAGARSAPGVLLSIPLVTLGCAVTGLTIAGAAGLAITSVVSGVLLGAVVRALGNHMRRPVDPVTLGLAGVLYGLSSAAAPAVVGAGRETFFAVWAGSALGATLLLPVVLVFLSRKPGSPLVQRPAEFAGVVLLIAGLAGALAAMGVTTGAPGFAAWLLLPLLLFVGWRYGVLAAALATLLSGTAGIWAASVRAPGSPGGFLERQVVCLVLAVVTMTIVLLLRDQRARISRERASAEVLAAFLGHADSMWYLKSIGADDEPLTYLRLGGGPFRERDYAAHVTDLELFGAEAAERITAADHEALRDGVGSAVVEHLSMPDGTPWTTLSNRFPVKDETGQIIALGGIRTDITEREALARVQEQQNRMLETVFVRSPVPSLRAYQDASGPLLVAAVNDAFGHVVGRDPAELVGTEVSSLLVEQDWPAVEHLLQQAPATGPLERWSPQAEVRVLTRIGQHRRALVTVAPLDAPSQHDREFLIHVEDVTARRAAEEAVAWYSLFDAVTGLLNRTAMSDRLDAALHRLGKDSPGVALITLDVDDFKSVNDSHGHGAGDHVLVEFGSRIQRVCDSRDSVARLSADEFAVLVEWEAKETVAVFVGRLQSALAEPVLIGETPVSCTVSFGVALTKDPEISAGEVVRQAELALFRAKRLGRGRVEFYAESMRAHAQAVLNVRNELTRAVAQDGFAVVYQPIVALDDGSVTSFEALVRLPATDGRILAPAAFLDVARSADLVTQIDRLVLREALSDLAGHRLPVAGCGLSVNVESDDLRDPDFAIGVLTQLHAFSVAPDLLTVEVTEAALLPFDEIVLGNMASLREAGVRFAIDDFGTGYSSLAQLRRLDVDVIKIDRSFVTAMESDQEDANIVATVVSLAHRLDLVAVAEGIETREQAEALQRLGCDRGQGYLFGHPQPISPRVGPEQTGTPTKPRT